MNIFKKMMACLILLCCLISLVYCTSTSQNGSDTSGTDRKEEMTTTDDSSDVTNGETSGNKPEQSDPPVESETRPKANIHLGEDEKEWEAYHPIP